MKHISKQRYGRYLGLLGAACLILSAALWALQMTFGRVAAILALAGLLGVLLYVVLDFKDIQAQLVKRSVKYGANTTVMILIVLGIIVLVQAISLRHNALFDLTRDQRYTLSEQTRSLLTALDRDVTVTAFVTSAHGGRDGLNDLLKQYADVSAHVSYEFVDPLKNPGRAQTYEITTDGVIVLEADNPETGRKRQKTFEMTEEALTNALIKVTREGTKIIYVISGHGEHALDDQAETGLSQFVGALQDENYEVKNLLLLQTASIPDDAAVVVLVGPRKDLLPTERETLKAYLARGGRLFGMFDPGYAAETSAFLNAYGVTVEDTTLIDDNPLNQLMGAAPTMPIAAEYGQHPITETLRAATIFPLARSLTIAETLPEGVTVEPLALSSESSWAETSQTELQAGEVTFTEGRDLPGPLPLALVITGAPAASVDDTTLDAETDVATEAEAEAEITAPETRIVMFGDSDFVSNAYVGLLGNADLALNAVNWLAEEEDLMAVRAKDPELAPLMLTAAQARMIFVLAVFGMPLAAIVIGITVYVNRRNATR